METCRVNRGLRGGQPGHHDLGAVRSLRRSAGDLLFTKGQVEKWALQMSGTAAALRPGDLSRQVLATACGLRDGGWRGMRKHPVGTMQEVRGLARELRGMWCGPLDRNPGDTWIQCPVAAHREMMAQFFDQPDYYTLIPRPVEAVAGDMRAEYKALGLRRLAPWDGKGSFGYAYKMNKHKDPINKVRPVVPCHREPSRRMSNVVARGYTFLLRKFKWLPESALWGTQELRPRLLSISRQVAKDFGPEARILGRSGDIKDMFTELKHPRLVKGVEILMAAAREMLKGKHLCVKIRGRGGVLVGKPPDRGKYVVVTIDDLQAGLLFDLRWCMLRLGALLLQQQRGIPMGKQSSPAHANAACALALYEWDNSLGADSKLVFESRYADDANLFAVYFLGDDASRARAEALLDRWSEDCYVDGLKLEVTSEGLSWDYLETVVTVGGSGDELVRCTHRNKNAGDVWRNGRRMTFQRFAHFASYAPRSARHGVLVATFLRVDANCTRASEVVFAAVELAVELCVMLQYPARTLKAAALRVGELRAERGAEWGAVAELLGRLAAVGRRPTGR